MKIALVGAFRATKLQAPYDDGDWRIWSCSLRNESELPRHDVWFELHDPVAMEAEFRVYAEWLKEQPFVWMQDELSGYPGSRRYPREKVLAAFGPYFLTGTLSYMAALAVLDSPEAIGFWGVGNCPEYAHQRPSLRFFAQAARDRGIEVIGPDHLLDPPKLYAFG